MRSRGCWLQWFCKYYRAKALAERGTRAGFAAAPVGRSVWAAAHSTGRWISAPRYHAKGSAAPAVASWCRCDSPAIGCVHLWWGCWCSLSFFNSLSIPLCSKSFHGVFILLRHPWSPPPLTSFLIFLTLFCAAFLSLIRTIFSLLLAFTHLFPAGFALNLTPASFVH